MKNRILVGLCATLSLPGAFLGASLAPAALAAEKTPLCDLYLVGRRQFLDQSFEIKDGKAKVAFFDADGTLRISSQEGILVAENPSDVLILPNVAARIKELNAAGYLIAIVSNQGGIPQYSTFKNTDLTLLQTIKLIRDQGAVIHYYDFAEKKDANRKPEGGMANNLRTALQMEFGKNVDIDLSQSFMVGDAAYKKGEMRPDGKPGNHFSNSDRIFAENLGIPFHEAEPYFASAKAEFKTATDAKLAEAAYRAGRKYVPFTTDALKTRIDAALAKSGAGYRNLSKAIIKDLAKVEFSNENERVLGYQTLANGFSYLALTSGGDWELPVFYIIYWDGKKLRSYIPTQGNLWNTKTHQAYGNNLEADLENANRRFVDAVDEDSEITDLSELRLDLDLIEADIAKRLYLDSGK